MPNSTPLDICRWDDLVHHVDSNTLLQLVMRLTNGTANPALVTAKIRQYRGNGYGN